MKKPSVTLMHIAMSNATPEIDALTDVQRDAINVRIIAGERLNAIKSIMDCCGVSLSEAMELNRARYRHLRETRGNAAGIQHSYRYTALLQVYSTLTGIQHSYNGA